MLLINMLNILLLMLGAITLALMIRRFTMDRNKTFIKIVEEYITFLCKPFTICFYSVIYITMLYLTN